MAKEYDKREWDDHYAYNLSDFPEGKRVVVARIRHTSPEFMPPADWQFISGDDVKDHLKRRDVPPGSSHAFETTWLTRRGDTLDFQRGTELLYFFPPDVTFEEFCREWVRYRTVIEKSRTAKMRKKAPLFRTTRASLNPRRSIWDSPSVTTDKDLRS